LIIGFFALIEIPAGLLARRHFLFRGCFPECWYKWKCNLSANQSPDEGSIFQPHPTRQTALSWRNVLDGFSRQTGIFIDLA